MSDDVINDNETYSDFWLNDESLHQYVPDGDFGKDFSQDLIQLATYRRIVSNFVFILTHKDITVQFHTTKKENANFTDGKTIYLSSSIRRKKDFDWTIGVALHEAAHILLTDFEAVKATFARIPVPVPQHLKKKIQQKNLSAEDVAYLCKWVWNYIEDRYIDTFIFNEAPGYRGYYKAMYDRFWNSKRISKFLKSKHYRTSKMKSYEFRVINLTNPVSDLDALIGLREIAETIGIDTITRLDTTVKRVDLTYKVMEIIIDNLPQQPKPDSQAMAKATMKAVHDQLSDKKKSDKDKKDDDKKSDDKADTQLSGNKPDEEDVVDGDEEPSEKEDKEEKGSTGNSEDKEITKEEKKEFNKELDKQHEFLNHDYDDIKEKISEAQESLLDVIEKSNIVLMPAGFGLKGDFSKSIVDVVVVKKLTKFLIDSGREVFPLAVKDMNGGPLQIYDDAIAKGFALGKLLGKRLQIRGEENIIKYIRKTSGKIERRLLADIGAGVEGIFSRTQIERYNKVRLHISVDASTSMADSNKWSPTMTCVTAICVAASMVRNLSVSVSFRSTIHISSGGDLPYVVLAYDSEVDKISKVRQIFPYLSPYGATPEGLAFEAISEEFIVGKLAKGQDNYFLNLSDGEPAYIFSNRNFKGCSVNFTYSGESAAHHTKRQINKIEAQGVRVLSYFIKSITHLMGDLTAYNAKLTTRQLFKIMYGKNAQFIDVENVVEIAKTMNELFLTKI